MKLVEKRCKHIMLLLWLGIIMGCHNGETITDLYSRHKQTIQENSYKVTDKYFYAIGSTVRENSNIQRSYDKAKIMAMSKLDELIVRDGVKEERMFPFCRYYFDKGEAKIKFRSLQVMERFTEKDRVFVSLGIKRTDVNLKFPDKPSVLTFWKVMTCKAGDYKEGDSIRLGEKLFDINELCLIVGEMNE